MRITITGPRSVGKSTVSKILAERLKLKYISSDELGNKILKNHGGLDGAIKSGAIKEILRKNGYTLLEKEFDKDKFVMDLSCGSISSVEFAEASTTLRKKVSKRSIVICLLPYANKEKSIKLLYSREVHRPHFKDSDKKLLLEKTKRNYNRLLKVRKHFFDHVIYTHKKNPEDIVGDIIKKLSLKR